MAKLQCPGCRKLLSLPDDKMGAAVVCPACKQKFRAGAPASRVGGTPTVKAAPPPQPKPQPKPAAVSQDYDVVDDEEPAAAPPETAVQKKTVARPAPAPAPKAEEEEVEDWEEVPEEEEEPRRKKETRPVRRRSKKHLRSRSDEGGSWLPWAIGVSTFALLLCLVAGIGVMAGYGAQVAILAVVMAIMIPVSTVILILSMIISSALGGGIEFGEVHIVIPKAVGLLIVVNLVSLIPFAGYLLTFPVWLIGLIVLFRLDFWEARFLIFINWLLNFGAKYIVMVVIIAAIFHLEGKVQLGNSRGGAVNAVFTGGGDDDEDDPKEVDEQCVEFLKQPTAVEARSWLKGQPLRTVSPFSHNEAESMVGELYSDGARRVTTLTAPAPPGGGREIASLLIIELPTDAAARKKVFARLKTMQKHGTKDQRQRYLLYEAAE